MIDDMGPEDTLSCIMEILHIGSEQTTTSVIYAVFFIYNQCYVCDKVTIELHMKPIYQINCRWCTQGRRSEELNEESSLIQTIENVREFGEILDRKLGNDDFDLMMLIKVNPGGYSEAHRILLKYYTRKIRPRSLHLILHNLRMNTEKIKRFQRAWKTT